MASCIRNQFYDFTLVQPLNSWFFDLEPHTEGSIIREFQKIGLQNATRIHKSPQEFTRHLLGPNLMYVLILNNASYIPWIIRTTKKWPKPDMQGTIFRNPQFPMKSCRGHFGVSPIRHTQHANTNVLTGMLQC